jgi:hypothetical protein
VLTRWQSGFAAAFVTLVTTGLVILDLADRGTRHWWDGHALTTDTVAGLLVLLITVLVVNQVVRLRQLKDRSRAIAAQAAIMMGQADRSSRAVSAALDGSGDRTAASDEVRTYMLMLMVGAPVLIDAKMSRSFLEAAQLLGGEMVVALGSGRWPTWMTGGSAADSSATTVGPGVAGSSSARLADAVQRLRAASAPLLQILSLDERIASGSDQDQ